MKSKRNIIQIDENLCNGCARCVSGCHEGALQMIDGKARLVSELYCDGLGACIGDCPVGAIKITLKEVEPYDEIAVMQRLIPKGIPTIKAHLKHLQEHGEMTYVNQALSFLKEQDVLIDIEEMNRPKPSNHSELRQWPVQLHLLNPQNTYFEKADVLLAADCTAFTYAGFHQDLLKNKILAIACPKLDSRLETYIDKITAMIDQARIHTLSVAIMEVPCCGGLMQIALKARMAASRHIPIQKIVISTHGEILEESWV